MIPGDTTSLRQELIAAARRLVSSGLTRNTSGNISHRVPGGFLVTPTGMPYETLEPEDIVFVDDAGAAHGRRLPSSEWRMHYDLFAARAEVSVVLHAHAPFCTSIACLGRGIPAFHYMIAMFGGADIRCAGYATFGTEELSRHAVGALDGRKGCLLANHGMITLGRSFDDAWLLLRLLLFLRLLLGAACFDRREVPVTLGSANKPLAAAGVLRADWQSTYGAPRCVAPVSWRWRPTMTFWW